MLSYRLGYRFCSHLKNFRHPIPRRVFSKAHSHKLPKNNVQRIHQPAPRPNKHRPNLGGMDTQPCEGLPLWNWQFRWERLGTPSLMTVLYELLYGSTDCKEERTVCAHVSQFWLIVLSIRITFRRCWLNMFRDSPSLWLSWPHKIHQLFRMSGLKLYWWWQRRKCHRQPHPQKSQ